MEDEHDETFVLESLWSEDIGSIDSFEFDPFAFRLPEASVSQKLQYLFSKGIIQPGPNKWRSPNDNMKLITLKCLYAAMVGFNKDNLSLLYSSGELGNTFDELWLTKAQAVESGSSVRDRCCGHVFEKGETYYRCKYNLRYSWLNVDNVVQILRSLSAQIVSTLRTIAATQ
jgi:hypothetical protein